MCGITGFWDTSTPSNISTIEHITKDMTATLYSRGPDSSGVWVDEQQGIGLGHRRLSIVDLSPMGHQPMLSHDGRYVIVFNGEIYNFQTIREELSQLGHKFKGSSDTEVMLAAFTQWGVIAATERFIGMFAFALWDRQEKVLHLGRDRLGEKPLYYGWIGSTFLFGSELKALKKHPSWQGKIDRNCLPGFFLYGYIPTPQTIYEGIYKLIPGTILSFVNSTSRPKPIAYWDLSSARQAGLNQPFNGNEEDAIAHLDNLLKDVISKQMIADVPLGAFLSGGVDSSTVVALMQSLNDRPIKTFTIGFYEDGYNEAIFAKDVAKHLGTEHTELYVTPEEAMAVIPKLPTLYDEPFADSSQIPTFLVSQLAKSHVTVSLSGDAGDELFGGYNRYLLGNNIWSKVEKVPYPIRRIIQNILTSISINTWDVFCQTMNFNYISGDRVHKLADILNCKNGEAFYHRMISSWRESESVVISDTNHNKLFNYPMLNDGVKNFFESMMYVDTLTYLPDDILVKVDRAAMGVSLESRVPFLDHRVVEFAWKLPLSMKVRGSQTKWLLRQVLYKYVPKELIERPKVGFGVPIDHWLRNELRDWAESLLDENRLKQEGFLNPQPIRQKWEEHLSGNRNWQYHLWYVLMFQAWLENESGVS